MYSVEHITRLKGKQTVMGTSEKEKLSPEVTLREAVTGLDTARDRLFENGLTDEDFTTACGEYADAVAAWDKAVASITKAATK